MESEYQRENQDTKMEIEVKPTVYVKQEENELQASNISKGKDHSDCSRFDCVEIENDIEYDKKYFLACLLMDIDLKYNLRLKRKKMGSFEKYHEKSMDILKKLNHKKTSYNMSWKTNKMKLKD